MNGNWTGLSLSQAGYYVNASLIPSAEVLGCAWTAVMIRRLFHEPYYRPKPGILHKIPARETSRHPPPILDKYHHVPPNPLLSSPWNLHHCGGRALATVTTARVAACWECPDSHEQYSLLFMSTVTRLLGRVPDRKDTLGYVIRACLQKKWDRSIG